MIYCDTSVVVAALAAEANSSTVRAWLNDHKNQIATSPWVATEVSNALAMKHRLGIIDAAALVRIRSAWRVLSAQLIQLSITDQDFHAASALIERPDLVIRSGDALHLAIAMRNGHTLATLDRKFATAALTVGIELADIL